MYVSVCVWLKTSSFKGVILEENVLTLKKYFCSNVKLLSSLDSHERHPSERMPPQPAQVYRICLVLTLQQDTETAFCSIQLISVWNTTQAVLIIIIIIIIIIHLFCIALFNDPKMLTVT